MLADAIFLRYGNLSKLENKAMYTHLVSTDLSKEMGGPISILDNKLHVEGTHSNQTFTDPPSKFKQAFIKLTRISFRFGQGIF
jgi:hypothetical protein